MSAATTPRSRPRSTSAASRRCRTRASTRARARTFHVVVTRRRTPSLCFEVADDGAGFDATPRRTQRPRLRQHGGPPRCDRRRRSRSTARRAGAHASAATSARSCTDAGSGRAIPTRGSAQAAVLLPELAHERRSEVLFVDVREIAPQSRASAGRSASEYVDSRMTTVSRFGGEDPPRRLDAVDAGQVDVHQHEVGMLRGRDRNRVLARLGFRGNLEAGREPDHRPGDGAERQLIVDDQYRNRFRRSVGCTHLVFDDVTSRVGPRVQPRRGRGGASSPAGQEQQDGLDPTVRSRALRTGRAWRTAS